MPNTEALVFDLGNVLINVDVNRCLQHWEKFSSLSLQELAALPQQGNAFAQHEVGQLSDEQYFDFIRQQMKLQTSDDEIQAGWNAMLGDRIEDTIAMIRQCNGKIPCYVFSNTNPSHQAKWSYDNPDFNDLFNHIFVSSEIALRKPTVESYQYVCREIGLAPEKVMFFDDREDNIAGAQSAGLQTVLVRDSQDVAQALEALDLL